MSSVEAENAKMRERTRCINVVQEKKADLLEKYKSLPGGTNTRSARVLRAKLSVCDELLRTLSYDL